MVEAAKGGPHSGPPSFCRYNYTPRGYFNSFCFSTFSLSLDLSGKVMYSVVRKTLDPQNYKMEEEKNT